jgi:hypothetical protein
MSQQINLFQPIFRKEPKKFSAKAMLQAGLLVLLGVGLLYGYSQWQVNSLRLELARAEARQTAAAKRLDEMSRKFGKRAKDRLLEREIARLEGVIAAKSRIKEILESGVFANTEGYSEYLMAFARQHVSGIWLTGFDIGGAGEKLTLEGRSTVPELVPQYMQRLASEDALSGIEFQVFRMERPEEEEKIRAPDYIEFLVTTANAGAAKVGQP